MGSPTQPVTTAVIVSPGLSFDVTTILVPVGQPLRITYRNEHEGVPHNVHVKGEGVDAATRRLAARAGRAGHDRHVPEGRGLRLHLRRAPFDDGCRPSLLSSPNLQYSRCCTVISVLTATTRLDALVVVGRALGDRTRCAVLLAVLDGVVYPAQIAAHLRLSRAGVSNHLTCLRGCGLVVRTPEGRQARYAVADAAIEHALRDLLSVVLAVEPHEHSNAAALLEGA